MFPALAGEFLTTGSPGKSNTSSILFYIFSQNLYSVYTMYQVMMLNIFHHLDVLLLGNTSVFRYRL